MVLEQNQRDALMLILFWRERSIYFRRRALLYKSLFRWRRYTI